MGSESEDACVVFPFVGSQTRFAASLRKKTFAIPSVVLSNLGQEQATGAALADEETVPSDLDVIDRFHFLHGRQNRDLEMNSRELFKSHGDKSRIADSRGDSAIDGGAIQRSGGMNIADAAAQFTVLMNRDENTARVRECAGDSR
jgi:hypothetical protein